MSKWQPLFYTFPIETMIRRYQKGYYQAIADSQTIPIDCRPFIEYTLNIIEQSLQDILKNGGLNGGLNLLQQEIISLIRDNRYDCSDVVATICELSVRGGESKKVWAKNLPPIQYCIKGQTRGGAIYC